MSEIRPPIEQGKIPQNKEQGIKPAETTSVPEKISPLKKASRAMRYVLDSALDTLPFPTKSAAANKYLLEVAKDEKPEPSTYKESVEAQEKKDVIVEAYGDEGPLEVLKGRESKVGRKVAVLVLGGGNGGIYNAGLLLEMQKQGLLENADGLFAVSSGAGNILAAGAGLGEDLVGVYGGENCSKVKVIDKKTKKEKEEGRFVKIPGAEDPKGQINALKDAYVNGSDKPIISTSSVEEALRSRAEAVKKEKGIDLKEALKSNPRDIQVLVMDKNTTNSEFLDLKKVDDPIGAVGGAICVPGVSDKGSVNGKVDGAFSRDPIPLDKILAMGYTDVVVLANGPAGESGQFRAIQVFLAEIAKNENGYGYNKDIIQLIRGHKRGSEIAAAKLEDKIRERNPNERVVVIGSARDGLRVEELCTDSEKIGKVYSDVRRLSGERIFNPAVKLGSAKPADLRNAGEELGAMAK
jgi:predicted patatin/cPLA2 family phospholipase